MESVYPEIAKCFYEQDAQKKAQQTILLEQHWRNGDLTQVGTVKVGNIYQPGYPKALCLVSPRELVQRKLSTLEGRAALIHAVAHIEFNAIHIALDAAYRFRQMPKLFFDDWLQVAAEEAKHFLWLAEHLAGYGYCYGDFPAHNGLWELTEKTSDSVLERMALVPRVMEARGLDVTPAMIKKLAQVEDDKAVEILKNILAEEIGHVAIGNRWYAYCCQQENIEPIGMFRKLLERHLKGNIKGPLNEPARIASGFLEEELQLLKQMIDAPSPVPR